MWGQRILNSWNLNQDMESGRCAAQKVKLYSTSRYLRATDNSTKLLQHKNMPYCTAMIKIFDQIYIFHQDQQYPVAERLSNLHMNDLPWGIILMAKLRWPNRDSNQRLVEIYTLFHHLISKGATATNGAA